MIPLYTPKHFSPQELVGINTWEDRGVLSLHLLDDRVLKGADMLRKAYGPIYVNTWSLSNLIRDTYGIRTESGLRTPGMNNYRPYSQHTFGRALDMLFQDVSAELVRSDIIHHRIKFPFPVIIEKGTTWLHFAVGNYRRGQEGSVIQIV